jgi:hypothetical protein
MTQSLLSAWNYQFSEFHDIYDESDKAEEAEAKARDDFLSSLRREPFEANAAMLRGRDFEKLIVLIAEGKSFRELMELEPRVAESPMPARSSTKTNWTKWYDGASQIAEIIRGGVFQASINKPLTVGDVEYVLHGKLDVLKCGVIYDIKFSSRYEYGNYFDSAQHPLYMALVPEAHTFTYLTYREYNGVFNESYRREDVKDISHIIADFMKYLEGQGLMDLYREKWLAK